MAEERQTHNALVAVEVAVVDQLAVVVLAHKQALLGRIRRGLVVVVGPVWRKQLALSTMLHKYPAGQMRPLAESEMNTNLSPLWLSVSLETLEWAAKVR